MCRDTVELAKRARYKPPAMRVRGKGYTKKSPFINIIRVFKLITKERKVILWQKSHECGTYKMVIHNVSTFGIVAGFFNQ